MINFLDSRLTTPNARRWFNDTPSVRESKTSLSLSVPNGRKPKRHGALEDSSNDPGPKSIPLFYVSNSLKSKQPPSVEVLHKPLFWAPAALPWQPRVHTPIKGWWSRWWGWMNQQRPLLFSSSIRLPTLSHKKKPDDSYQYFDYNKTSEEKE